ncbi:SNF2 helicase-associated domain-containing protein [Desulfovibrio desulfuricans]|uniref:SNF2 helicase-associated domain-containing protein n=1 Tax=Desulfovibrio desulfuricans TaxID=876 RepID=UPI0035B22870
MPYFSGGGRSISLDVIAEFDWQVSLGREPVAYKNLLALARLKVPLVQVRGQCVEVNSQEILAAADFWKKNSKNAAPAWDILRPLAVRMPPTALPLAVRRVRAGSASCSTSWRAKRPARNCSPRQSFAELCSPIRRGDFSGSPFCSNGAWGPAWPMPRACT